VLHNAPTFKQQGIAVEGQAMFLHMEAAANKLENR
jgi:hypothetical protein